MNLRSQKAHLIFVITKEQMERLCKLLSANQVTRTSLMAQKGTSLTDFGGIFRKVEPWIFDSGAMNHMTSYEKLFSSYIPSSNNHRVKVADGSYALVAGIGTVAISPKISLQSVLYVPKLSCNLISISKITKDLECMINFSSTACVFQDKIMGRMIGNAKESDGLYYFENMFPENRSKQTVVCNLSLSIMLLHWRLGHPSFGT